MTEDKLLELKEKITTAKDEVAKLKGRLEVISETLVNQWECNSIEEAQQKVEDIKNRKLALEEKINKAIRKLEQTYDFETD